MRHLRLLVVIVFLVLVALTGTAVLHGRALSDDSAVNPLQAMRLDTCNGRLCFMQLVPGVTTWDEAKQVLANYMLRDDGDHFHSQVDGLQIRVDGGEYGSEIRRVDIQSSGQAGSSFSVPFSEIIRQFGTPCSVGEVRSQGGGLLLIYPSFQLSVSTEESGRLSPDSMVSGITLQGDSSGDLCNGYDPYSTPWRGFASVDFYEAQLRIDR